MPIPLQKIAEGRISIEEKDSSLGQVSFDVLSGSYYVRAYDAAGIYKTEESNVVALEGEKTESINLSLEKGVIGEIELTIKAV